MKTISAVLEILGFLTLGIFFITCITALTEIVIYGGLIHLTLIYKGYALSILCLLMFVLIGIIKIYLEEKGY